MTPATKKFSLITYGCQMNYADTDRITTVLAAHGFERTSELIDSDLVLFNTCMVRQKPEDKVFGHLLTIRKLKREKPHLRVGLAGCMVRKSGVSKRFESALTSDDALLKRSREIDFVFRTKDLLHLGTLLKDVGLVETNYEFTEDDYLELIPTTASTASAFVPIMTGCNRYCTYCVVPYSRGKEVSRSIADVVHEVEILSERGLKEVTLLGQIVNSYHPEGYKKGDTSFVELIRAVHEIPGIERIRYTSPHPQYMTDELIEAHRVLPKLCRHIHLPVQSGSTAVLERMNRGYTREHYLDLVRRIRTAVPDIAITTDIIAGFCGETEEEFLESVSLYQDVGFDFAFLAQYSPRPESYSARKWEDDVSKEDKQRRWHILNDTLLSESAKKYRKLIHQDVSVLVEKHFGDTCMGKTPDAKTVKFQTSTPDIFVGTIQRVNISEVRETEAIGVLLS